MKKAEARAKAARYRMMLEAEGYVRVRGPEMERLQPAFKELGMSFVDEATGVVYGSRQSGVEIVVETWAKLEQVKAAETLLALTKEGHVDEPPKSKRLNLSEAWDRHKAKWREGSEF